MKQNPTKQEPLKPSSHSSCPRGSSTFQPPSQLSPKPLPGSCPGREHPAGTELSPASQGTTRSTLTSLRSEYSQAEVRWRWGQSHHTHLCGSWGHLSTAVSGLVVAEANWKGWKGWAAPRKTIRSWVLFT